MSDMVQVSFRCPVEQALALERVARANDRTVSSELRRVLRKHLADQPAAAAAPPIPGQLAIEDQEAAA